MDKLPIDMYTSEIMESISVYPVTLIVGETGSGKSTRVPRFILDSGMTCLVTQPRRLAAVTVANRVAAELGQCIGGNVGYATRYEKCFSDETKCLFCTDGLGVVRELLGTNKYEVLVIDEVHEFNLNIEMLLGWVQHQLKNGTTRRIVLMSATVEKKDFLQYFGDMLNILEVEGRTFPVQDMTDVVPITSRREVDRARETIQYMASQKHNTLVFLPGKGEIAKWKDYLSDPMYGVPLPVKVLELHGEMRYEEQKAAFALYDRPKVILATNVAQTSITIPDVTAVVDTEMERRIEIVNGVEGLNLRRIAKSDVQQRMGRAGRVQEGIYLSLYDGYGDQLDYPVSEIQRLYLDHVYLKICAAGLDPEELQFFHQPSTEQLVMARKLLIRMGCLTQDRKLTALGGKFVKYPVSVRYAKMLYVADKLGVFEPVLQIVCFLNSNACFKEKIYRYKTDLQIAAHFLEIVEGKKPEDLKEMGIHWKAIKNFKEMYNKFKTMKDIGTDNSNYWPTWEKIEKEVELSVVSGMLDMIWVKDGQLISKNNFSVGYSSVDGWLARWDGGSSVPIPRCDGRQIDRNSMHSGYYDIPCAAGFPIDIRFKGRYNEDKELNILTFVIPFRNEWVEWFPEFFGKTFKVEPIGHTVDIDTVVQVYGEKKVPYDLMKLRGGELGSIEIPPMEIPMSSDLARVLRAKYWDATTQIAITMGVDASDLIYPVFEAIIRLHRQHAEYGYDTKCYSILDPNLNLEVKPVIRDVPRKETPTWGTYGSWRTSTDLPAARSVPEQTPAAQNKWVLKGKWVTCPNGHTLKYLKASGKNQDATLRCDICECVGTL